MTADSSMENLIEILSNATEYAQLPVRHNEDQINSDLAKQVPIEVNKTSYDSAHTKTHLLLQAHFCQMQLPSTDYHTDTKSVLDQAIRILQAMLDTVADEGWLVTSLRVVMLIQMVIQGRWWHDNTLLTLPNFMPYHIHCLRPREGTAKKKGFPELKAPIETLPELMAICDGKFDPLEAMLGDEMSPQHQEQVYQVLCRLPQISVTLTIKGWWEGGTGQKEERPVSTKYQGGRRQESDCIQVHADQEYALQVDLHRLNRLKKTDSKAHAPRFPKSKDEGWFLIVGDVENKEMIALKRIGYIRNRSSATLAMFMPETVGRVIYTLYIMSDSYLGLDQQYDICLDVIPKSIEAQVNTELAAELDDMNV
ncbi:hypothetical protein ACJMK2_029590 [Sinanodonta woodiana]|uniref:SEC63 domain-containing protein n=1 Tax=Sinanodonta woodiana TaxID=1069815 RepID=A0ABD3XAL6_SINWO